MVRNVVGKSTRHVSRDKMIFNMRLMYQVRMGYIDLEKANAFRSIAFSPEEHLYDHDLSIQSIGRQYQIKKIKEHMPLELYLNLPIGHAEMLLQGMMIGDEERVKLEEFAASETARAEALRKEQAAQGFNDIHEQNANNQ